jgi:hypothetical protein
MPIASLFMRAIQLAESGRHHNCLTVEIALAAEGYAEAFDVFKDDRLRAGISAICQKSWHPNAEGDTNDNRLMLEGEEAKPATQDGAD